MVSHCASIHISITASDIEHLFLPWLYIYFSYEMADCVFCPFKKKTFSVGILYSFPPKQDLISFSHRQWPSTLKNFQCIQRNFHFLKKNTENSHLEFFFYCQNFSSKMEYGFVHPLQKLFRHIHIDLPLINLIKPEKKLTLAGLL